MTLIINSGSLKGIIKMNAKEKDYAYLTKRLHTLVTREYANNSYRLDNIAYFAGLIIKDHLNNRIEIDAIYKPITLKNDRVFTFHLGLNVYLFCRHFDNKGLFHLYFYEKAAGEMACLNFHLKDENRLLRGFYFYYNENTKKVDYLY